MKKYYEPITFDGRTYTLCYTDNLHADLGARFTELYKAGDLPKTVKFDTESTGLHIKKDKPFMGSLAYRTPSGIRESWVFDATPANFKVLIWLSKTVEYIYAHNTVFDMHMAAHMIGHQAILDIGNWADTQALLRGVFDAVSPNNGGDKLGLKTVAVKYVDRDANRYEVAVKKALKDLRSQQFKILTVLLRRYNFSKSKLMTCLKAELPIPDEVKTVYKQWQKDYPEPTYADVPTEIMYPYAAADVILTDIIEEDCSPIISDRKQWNVVKREFKNLRSTYKMTSRGFNVDQGYLKDCKIKLDIYIEKLQKEMHELAGRVFTVSQEKVIADLYEKKLGIRPESTDKNFLKKRIAKGDRLALLIKKLRSLEKWRSTYLDRMLADSEYDGRLYVGLTQFGAVTGRYSGDFQQMPKNPLLTLEGDAQSKTIGGIWTPGKDGCDPEQELFYPRKAIINTEGYRMFFLDFSQEELRFQAHFTLYLGSDLNLCRAYMPFKCIHYETGEIYNFQDSAGRERWRECRKGSPEGHWEDILKAGHSAWVIPETGKPWIPTDVHGSTAREALKLMGTDPDTVEAKVFKYWRNIGKTYNFMKTYGGGPAKSAEVLDITYEECKSIDDGFIISFPMIPKYQESIVNTFHKQGYIVNMFDRRYYLSDSRMFYKGANYNIQGSCADDLKEKIPVIDEFLEKNNCLSQILQPVHDELIFDIAEGEECIVGHLCGIMMKSPKLLVPLVVEPDYTESSWAAKKAYKMA